MKCKNPGAALNAMRPFKQYTCKQCCKVFKARDTRAQFCGNSCRMAYRYANTKAQSPKKQMGRPPLGPPGKAVWVPGEILPKVLDVLESHAAKRGSLTTKVPGALPPSLTATG